MQHGNFLIMFVVYRVQAYRWNHENVVDRAVPLYGLGVIVPLT